MDQRAYLAVTAMLNAFPQGNSNPDLTMKTFETLLANLSSQAVVEAAMRFVSGEVTGQNMTFAPSIAEFVQEAKRIADLIPYRGRMQITQGDAPMDRPITEAERVRMGFKMSLLSFALGCNAVDRVDEANKQGLEHLIALGQEWHIPIPEELWRQLKGKAA